MGGNHFNLNFSLTRNPMRIQLRLTMLVSSKRQLREPKTEARIARLEEEWVEAAWPFVRPLFYEVTKLSPFGRSTLVSVSPLQCLRTDP